MTSASKSPENVFSFVKLIDCLLSFRLSLSHFYYFLMHPPDLHEHVQLSKLL